MRLGEKSPVLERQAGNMANYPVGDFLIRVKNAALAKGKKLTVPSTLAISAVAQSLKKLGFFDDVKKDKNELSVTLTYKNKKPVLMDLKLISKPGLRIYMGVGEIEKKKGPSLYLISTPKGIVSSREAVKERIGGEVIAEVL